MKGRKTDALNSECSNFVKMRKKLKKITLNSECPNFEKKRQKRKKKTIKEDYCSEFRHSIITYN